MFSNCVEIFRFLWWIALCVQITSYRIVLLRKQIHEKGNIAISVLVLNIFTEVLDVFFSVEKHTCCVTNALIYLERNLKLDIPYIL